MDPERSLASAVARARRELRRWCVANGATRLATLTFAVEPSLDEGWRLIEGFRRRLDAAGYRQPAVIPQYGDVGGRLHFHLALPDFIPKATLAALWGHGFIDVRVLDRQRNKRVQLSKRELARLVARYVAGYVARPGTAPAGEADGAAPAKRSVGFNRRRYSIPKNGAPVRVVRFTCVGGYFEAWAEAQRQCGHHLHDVWHSPVDDDAWRGPPTVLLMG